MNSKKMDCNQSMRRSEECSVTDPPSSSTSPASSGISESPREPSVSLSLIASPIGRPDCLDGSSFFPKTEPVVCEHDENQEDGVISVIKAEPADSIAIATTPLGRRPRGRPRKPKIAPLISPRDVKGRTKTGCFTCRRRKKKCDERKPHCKNCEQNNVKCEGYPPRVAWKNGKERAAEQNIDRWRSEGAAPLPNFVDSLETRLDWEFYEHYETELAKRLNISPDKNNPFIVIVIPLALAHKGVMHALLSCSAAHYVHQLRDQQEGARYQEVKERQEYHEKQAFQSLMIEKSSGDAPENRNDVICRALLFWLKNIVGGDSNGEWKFHERGVANLLKENPQSGEEDVWKFAMEFYQYHKMSSLITNADTPDTEVPPYMQLTEENKQNFMSVCEGLEIPTMKIHQLRKKVRKRRQEEVSPYLNYALMSEAYWIDLDLRKLKCPEKHVISTPDWICWNLYHNCVWLLLQRTMMSGPHLPSNANKVVEEALEYIKSVGPDQPVLSVFVMPVFIIGICAFDQGHRQPVRDAFDVCEAYSHNGNIQHCRTVLDKLWELMDVQDPTAWDYERVMKTLDVDTLFT